MQKEAYIHPLTRTGTERPYPNTDIEPQPLTVEGYQITTELLTQLEHEQNARNVYMALLCHAAADETLAFYMTESELAELTGLKRESLKRAICYLVDIGALRTAAHGKPPRRSRCYQVTAAWTVKTGYSKPTQKRRSPRTAQKRAQSGAK